MEHLLNVKDCILKPRKRECEINLSVSTHSLCTWFHLNKKGHILKLEQIDLIYSCPITRPKVTHRKLTRIKNEALNLCNASVSLTQWIKFSNNYSDEWCYQKYNSFIVILGL